MSGACSGVTTTRRAPEGAVIALLTTLLLQSDLLEEAWAEAQASRGDVASELREERERIQTRRGRLEQKRRRYFQAFEDGTLEPGLCQERLAELGAQAEQLATEEGSIAERLDACEAPGRVPATGGRDCAQAPRIARGGRSGEDKSPAGAADRRDLR
jgi:hypothetical protein